MPTRTRGVQCVVVVRHGERLDYVERDAGRNWVQANIHRRPWDPPLTDLGVQQAVDLGEALHTTILQELALPSIGAIYSSPFLRCRQTAGGIRRGYCHRQQNGSGSDSVHNSDDPDPVHKSNDDDGATTSAAQQSSSSLQVKVELGLSESINQNWYRSWALPGADGTWGYMKSEIPFPDSNDLHPLSKESVHKHVLDWRECADDTVDLHSALIKECVDRNHQSLTDLERYYSYDPPKFESCKTQRDRMAAAMNVLSERHVNETIVLVSHGGPVTHLYESVTRNNWHIHGESRFCCYSIYVKDVQQQQDETNDETIDETNTTQTSLQWTPLIVNRCLWDDTSASDAEVEGRSSQRNATTFQWS
jgi:broad specificity phosphatase PhoE